MMNDNSMELSRAANVRTEIKQAVNRVLINGHKKNILLAADCILVIHQTKRQPGAKDSLSLT